MRQIRFTPEAEETLAGQIDYVINLGAVGPAQALKSRVEGFLATLSHYPRTGRQIEDRQFWETWIPRTRLVVWYTFDAAELVVIAFWHTSQNRELEGR